MNPPIRPVFFCVAMLMAPVAYCVDTPVPAAVDAASAGGLSNEQLSTGLKRGLNAALQDAMGKLTATDGLSLSAPPALAQIASKLGGTNSSGAADALTASLKAAAEKIAPQAAGLMRESFKAATIDDPKTLLGGGADAGTQFIKKSVSASLRAKLLPLVTEATAATGVGTKAKEMLAAVGPFAALAGKSSVTDLDGYVCDQVINQAFLLMGKEEAALRANPALLKNALAQKVFSLTQQK